MAQQLNNFRVAYQVLDDRVRGALHTQLGDAARLGEQRDQALGFLQAAEQVSPPFLCVIGFTHGICLACRRISCWRICDTAAEH